MIWLLCAWAVLALGFSAVALVRVRLWQRATREQHTKVAALGPAPSVVLLRPLDVPTRQELINLAVPVDYPGQLRHIVLSPSRPRLPAHVEWRWSNPQTSNRKVGHLLEGLAGLSAEASEGHAEPGAVVLSVDPDVAVDGALVESLVRALAGGAGLASAAPSPQLLEKGSDAQSLALEGLLGHTHHDFRVLHVMRAGAATVCGKAMALGTAAQEELARLGEHIGEDLELASRLHARGVHVAFGAVPARLPLEPGRDALGRMTRWMQVLRTHRPALAPSIPLLFAPTLPLVMLAICSASPVLGALVLALMAVRVGLALVLDEGRAPQRAVYSWLLGEALLLGAFVRSLFRREVSWRGRTFRLLAGGRMQPKPAPTPLALGVRS